MWVDYTDGNGKKVSVIGYDDAVQIVPAPTSWFDLQLYVLSFPPLLSPTCR